MKKMYIKKENLLKFRNHPRKARESYVGPPPFSKPRPLVEKLSGKFSQLDLDMHRFFGKNPTAFISICAVTSSYTQNQSKQCC